MKLSQILVVCFVALLCTSVQSSKIQKRKAIVRAFGEGFLSVLSGGHLAACIGSWASTALADDASKDSWVTKWSQSSRAADIIIKVVRAVSRVLCSNHFERLSNFIKEHIFGKRRRFYLEKKSKTKFVEEIKGMVKIKDSIKEWIRTAKDYVSRIKDLVKRGIECAKGAGAVFSNLRNIITAITVLTATGGLYAGFWPVFVAKLLCAWEKIINAIQYLVTAVRQSGDQRALQFGKFVGTLLIIFGEVVVPLQLPVPS